MKTCSACKALKGLAEFWKCKRNSDGLLSRCIECTRQANKRYHSRNIEKVRAYYRASRRKNPIPFMVSMAKVRAKQRGVPFNLTVNDLTLPDNCPVLGIPLRVGGNWQEAPSLDCIIPADGYVPGNIQVMSKLANTMKSSASPAQLIRFATWVRQNYGLRDVPAVAAKVA